MDASWPKRKTASRRRTRHDVAIHAPFAGKLYVPGERRASGGAEFQMTKLALVLSERGLRVCHVVFDYEGIDPAEAGDVSLVTQPADQFNDNLLVYSRSTARALAEADAAVYIQRTAGFETGVVAGFAKARRRRFVFSSSSSTDLLKKPPLPTWASLRAYRTGLRLADEVVVQTAEQQALGRESLRGEPRLIRSFSEPAPAVNREREAFLWIGGLIDYKDPLAYVRLAELVPDARFWMIGTGRGAEWESLADEVEAAARRLPNLELLDPRPREALRDLYARTVAVVNTSQFEGFPNTFMEGWAGGAAALSLRIDPDGVIRRHRLGYVADGSVEAFAAGARQLWERREDAETASAARRYIAENHDPDVVGRRWAELVESLIANRRGLPKGRPRG